MSDSSDLSSAPSDDELDLQLTKKDGILKFFSKAPKPTSKPREETPPRKKRDPSPEHVYCLADNPDIAVCMHAVGASIAALHFINAFFCLRVLANATIA